MGSREQGSTGRQPDLAERLAAIKPGDTVTARLRYDADEYTVTGIVRADGGYCHVGHSMIRWHGCAAEHLVAIESHEPAKPPVPPEPTGDVVVRERGLKDRDRWWAPRPGACGDQWWECLSDDRRALHEWNELRDALVYRPVPSPERIEELVQATAREIWSGVTDDDPDVLRRFAAALLGGEQS